MAVTDGVGHVMLPRAHSYGLILTSFDHFVCLAAYMHSLFVHLTDLHACDVLLSRYTQGASQYRPR